MPMVWIFISQCNSFWFAHQGKNDELSLPSSAGNDVVLASTFLQMLVSIWLNLRKRIANSQEAKEMFPLSSEAPSVVGSNVALTT